MDTFNWKLIFMEWMQGVVKAATRMIGSRQVKTLIRGMSLVFVNSMIKRIAEETNTSVIIQTSSLKEALEKYQQLEATTDLSSANKVQIKGINDDEVEVTIQECIYGDFCNEALAQLISTGEFNEKSLPCLRLSNYSAAAAQLAQIKAPYFFVQFAPGAICKGHIKSSR